MPPKQKTEAEMEAMAEELFQRTKGLGVTAASSTSVDVGEDERKQWAYCFAMQRIFPNLEIRPKQTNSSNTQWYLASAGSLKQTVECWTSGALRFDKIPAINDSHLTAVDFLAADKKMAELAVERAQASAAEQAAFEAHVSNANAGLQS